MSLARSPIFSPDSQPAWGRAGEPPRSRPQLFNDSHLRGHWPGDGVARPGLLCLTAIFRGLVIGGTWHPGPGVRGRCGLGEVSLLSELGGPEETP